MILREYQASDTLLPEILTLVENELERLECPLKISMQIAIAVEEIFVNIAHYAYNGAPGPMTFCMTDDGAGTVAIRFTDSGIPFDPLKREDPDITLQADKRDVGGLGIYMVKQTMDNVTYEYKDAQNILTLYKKIL